MTVCVRGSNYYHRTYILPKSSYFRIVVVLFEGFGVEAHETVQHRVEVHGHYSFCMQSL